MASPSLSPDTCTGNAHPRTGNREQVVGSISLGRAVLAVHSDNTSLPSIFLLGTEGSVMHKTGLCPPRAHSLVGGQAGKQRPRCKAARRLHLGCQKYRIIKVAPNPEGSGEASWMSDVQAEAGRTLTVAL